MQDKILPRDPFVSLDVSGVGALMELAAEKGRQTRPELKLGICGEHGGDPVSVSFCQRLGLSYVSCSPYRVPVARLAAAQAALRQHGEGARAGVGASVGELPCARGRDGTSAA